MAKAKHKKKKVLKTTLTKSVFLYGQPNADKLKKLVAVTNTFLCGRLDVLDVFGEVFDKSKLA